MTDNFPPPSQIFRNSPAQAYQGFVKGARICFNNLIKEFENQSSYGEPKLSIPIKRFSTYGGDSAEWIKKHFDYPTQRACSVDYCNMQLAGTGWSVTAIRPAETRKQTWDYEKDGWHWMSFPALTVDMEWTDAK